MAKIDQFKTFVRKYPSLISQVNSGTTTWQKLYEIWDLYGEDNSVWDTYITPKTNASNEMGLKDIFDNFRNINMDSVHKGLNGLQRALDLAQELFGKKEDIPTEDPYIPRPIHRRFDD